MAEDVPPTLPPPSAPGLDPGVVESKLRSYILTVLAIQLKFCDLNGGRIPLRRDAACCLLGTGPCATLTETQTAEFDTRINKLFQPFAALFQQHSGMAVNKFLGKYMPVLRIGDRDVFSLSSSPNKPNWRTANIELERVGSRYRVWTFSLNGIVQVIMARLSDLGRSQPPADAISGVVIPPQYYVDHELARTASLTLDIPCFQETSEDPIQVVRYEAIEFVVHTKWIVPLQRPRLEPPPPTQNLSAHEHVMEAVRTQLHLLGCQTDETRLQSLREIYIANSQVQHAAEVVFNEHVFSAMERGRISALCIAHEHVQDLLTAAMMCFPGLRGGSGRGLVVSLADDLEHIRLGNPTTPDTIHRTGIKARVFLCSLLTYLSDSWYSRVRPITVTLVMLLADGMLDGRLHPPTLRRRCRAVYEAACMALRTAVTESQAMLLQAEFAIDPATSKPIVDPAKRTATTRICKYNDVCLLVRAQLKEPVPSVGVDDTLRSSAIYERELVGQMRRFNPTIIEAMCARIAASFVDMIASTSPTYADGVRQPSALTMAPPPLDVLLDSSTFTPPTPGMTNLEFLQRLAQQMSAASTLSTTTTTTTQDGVTTTTTTTTVPVAATDAATQPTLQAFRPEAMTYVEHVLVSGLQDTTVQALLNKSAMAPTPLLVPPPRTDDVRKEPTAPLAAEELTTSVAMPMPMALPPQVSSGPRKASRARVMFDSVPPPDPLERRICDFVETMNALMLAVAEMGKLEISWPDRHHVMCCVGPSSMLESLSEDQCTEFKRRMKQRLERYEHLVATFNGSNMTELVQQLDPVLDQHGRPVFSFRPDTSDHTANAALEAAKSPYRVRTLMIAGIPQALLARAATVSPKLINMQEEMARTFFLGPNLPSLVDGPVLIVRLDMVDYLMQRGWDSTTVAALRRTHDHRHAYMTQAYAVSLAMSGLGASLVDVHMILGTLYQENLVLYHHASQETMGFEVRECAVLQALASRCPEVAELLALLQDVLVVGGGAKGIISALMDILEDGPDDLAKMSLAAAAAAADRPMAVRPPLPEAVARQIRVMVRACMHVHDRWRSPTSVATQGTLLIFAASLVSVTADAAGVNTPVLTLDRTLVRRIANRLQVGIQDILKTTAQKALECFQGTVYSVTMPSRGAEPVKLSYTELLDSFKGLDQGNMYINVLDYFLRSIPSPPQDLTTTLIPPVSLVDMMLEASPPLQALTPPALAEIRSCSFEWSAMRWSRFLGQAFTTAS